MRSRPTNSNSIVVRRSQLWICVPILLTSFAVLGRAQAIKFNELPDLSADDTQAHLDLFAKRLMDGPQTKGTFVAYYPESWPPGLFLRHIHGYADYLVSKRGIAADRLAILVGGAKDKFRVELWLVPPGSSAPAPSATTFAKFNQLTKFDSLSFGPGCESQYTLTLEDPSDAIRFFASSLRQNPTMKGMVLIHPWRYQDDRDSRKLIKSTIPRLVKEHSIPLDLLTVEAAEARYCGEVQFWVVPQDFVLPKGQTSSTYLQSRLMDEADGRYFVRRVEFVGNRFTRDNVLRKSMPLLQEGEVFTKARLHKSLAEVSQLSVIKPIRIRDVEAHLNRDELTIDLTLFFRERRLGRK